MQHFSKPGLILSISYLGLSLIAALIFLTSGPGPGTDLPLVILSLPWSMLLGAVTSLGTSPEIWSNFETPLFFIAFLINAIILYKLISFFDSTNKKDLVIAAQPPTIINNLWKKFNIFFFLFLILYIISYFISLDSGFFRNYFSLLTKLIQVINLGYFGFALTQKRKYFLLGLPGLIPFFTLIFFFAGYFILLEIKNSTSIVKTVPEHS